MIEREIKWKNFLDEEMVRKYGFHITKAEAVETALGFGKDAEDIQAVIQRIVDTRDAKVIIGSFKTILLASVGVRSADQRQFIKNDETKDEFQYSGAMDELLIQMYSDPAMAAALIQGMFPTEIIKQAEDAGVIKDGQFVSATPSPEEKILNALEETATRPMPYEMVDLGKIPDPPKPIDDKPVQVIDDRKDELKKYTRGELMAMSDDDFFATVGTNHKKWSRDVMEMAFIRRTSAAK